MSHQGRPRKKKTPQHILDRKRLYYQRNKLAIADKYHDRYKVGGLLHQKKKEQHDAWNATNPERRKEIDRKASAKYRIKVLERGKQLLAKQTADQLDREKARGYSIVPVADRVPKNCPPTTRWYEPGHY